MNWRKIFEGLDYLFAKKVDVYDKRKDVVYRVEADTEKQALSIVARRLRRKRADDLRIVRRIDPGDKIVHVRRKK